MTANLTFGIKTTPQAVSYEDMLAVWLEADSLVEIDHAWLWDHLLPLGRATSERVLDGWSLLAALAARTERLRLGLLVSSNAYRPPVALAKMATTIDAISNGRLVLGLGVGGTRQPDGVPNPAVAEHGAAGIPLVSPPEGIGRLDEACTILRRLWRESEPFDFAGEHYDLHGAVSVPRPVQASGIPLLLGGWGDRTLAVVARHADIWNIPGPPHRSIDAIAERSRVLDEHCRAQGRDPQAIVRSVQTVVAYDDAAGARSTIGGLVDIGVTHIVLAVPTPLTPGCATWLAEEVIAPVRAERSAA